MVESFFVILLLIQLLVANSNFNQVINLISGDLIEWGIQAQEGSRASV